MEPLFADREISICGSRSRSEDRRNSFGRSVSNPGNVLRPGQYGRVRAVTKLKAAALLIPQRAVTELQGTYQVAVVGSDKKVTFRTVKLGERTGSSWVVDEGLKAGETIVAEGTLKVRPGMIVNTKPFTEAVTTASN